jgi:hypothetical protein
MPKPPLAAAFALAVAPCIFVPGSAVAQPAVQPGFDTAPRVSPDGRWLMFKRSDLLFAGTGNDHVLGGPGQDDHFGGPGNDTLASADGAADRLFCGPGRDRVVADRLDFVARDCARVSRR